MTIIGGGDTQPLLAVLNKECFSALCHASVTHGFSCVWISCSREGVT